MNPKIPFDAGVPKKPLQRSSIKERTGIEAVVVARKAEKHVRKRVELQACSKGEGRRYDEQTAHTKCSLLCSVGMADRYQSGLNVVPSSFLSPSARKNAAMWCMSLTTTLPDCGGMRCTIAVKSPLYAMRAEPSRYCAWPRPTAGQSNAHPRRHLRAAASRTRALLRWNLREISCSSPRKRVADLDVKRISRERERERG